MSSGIFRAFSTVGGWTMASRLLGFGRDMLMSRILGAGYVADAYNLSFQLPNLFRRFLAEGAFNSAFVPQFRKKLDNEAGAQAFAQNSFAGLLLIALIVIALVQIFMSSVILGLASGYAGDERFRMAQNFSHITIFYIGFMSLSALCSGILNSYGRFAVAAAAPVFLNIILISVLIAVHFLGVQGEAIGYWLSWGVFVAGVTQFLFVYIGVRKLGIKLRPAWPHWDQDLKHLLVVALPATLSAGVVQINIIIGRQIASWTEGAISWLSYADRLYQLPVGTIGVAMGVALLPSLTSMVANNDLTGAKQRYNEGVLFAAFFTIPAAFALFAIPEVLVSVIFEGGKFDHSDTIATANALRIYAVGVPAMVLAVIQRQLFFAREDTKTPFRFAIFDIIINITISLSLWSRFGYLAPVIGTVSSSWALYLLLYIRAQKFGDAVHFTTKTKRSLFSITLLSFLSGALAWLLSHWWANALTLSFVKWLLLFAIIGICAGFYLVLALHAIGLRPANIKAMLKR